MQPGALGVLGWPRRVGVLACCGAYAVVLCMFPMGGSVIYEVLKQWHAILNEAEVLAIAFAVSFIAARLSSSDSPRYIAILMLAATIGVATGCLFKMGWYGMANAWRQDPVLVSTLPITYLGVAWIGAGLWVWHQREAALSQAMHFEQLRRSGIERQVAAAQMRALQAQVEPHFLFNTLAHLRRLYATEPLAARNLLRDLRHYLRGLQPALHRTTITLAEDAEYARAYLELQRTRMGSRLRYSITLAPETIAVHVPPLAVTTLVENSIKHGLAAVPDGGSITIVSRSGNGLVQLEVADDGAGLKTGHGTGVGLANLQARLHSTYGAQGTLNLRQRPQGGALAQFTVPCDPLR